MRGDGHLAVPRCASRSNPPGNLRPLGIQSVGSTLVKQVPLGSLPASFCQCVEQDGSALGFPQLAHVSSIGSALENPGFHACLPPPGARARESCKVNCVGRELVLSGLGRLGFESGYGIPTPLMSRTLALPSSPLVHYDLNLPRPPRGSPHAS